MGHCKITSSGLYLDYRLFKHRSTNLSRNRNPYDPGAELPGALGKGQAVATALGNFFKFWAYASTVIGAIVAGTVPTPTYGFFNANLLSLDQFLGKFKAILVACAIYIVGLTVLVTTATPASIKGGSAFGGLVASMVILGLGTGGIKANVTPFCAEQYQKVHAYVKTLKSGERVIVDPDLTVERMFMWYVDHCIYQDLFLTHS